MITGELKNKIDSLWAVFAAGGLVNPLDVIEQITYLMFIRDFCIKLLYSHHPLLAWTSLPKLCLKTNPYNMD